MRRYNTTFDAQFIQMFMKVTAVISFAAAVVSYWLASDVKVVVIAKTKVMAQPVVDYLWPVLLLAVIGSVLVCSIIGALFYSWIKRKIRKPSERLRQDLQRIAAGDVSQPVEFWSAEDIYDVAVEVEKTREAWKNRLVLATDRYNAMKNFLDQKNFEVNGQNRELLKQKLQSVDDQLKGFKLRRQPIDLSQQIVSIEPQPEKVVKDAEEMIKA